MFNSVSFTCGAVFTSRLLALTLMCASAFGSETIGSWDISKANSDLDTLIVPFAAGAAGEFVTNKPKGIILQGDPTAPGGKALVFDGMQNQYLYATETVSWPEGRKMAIDVVMKPSTAAIHEGWVMRLGSSFDSK